VTVLPQDSWKLDSSSPETRDSLISFWLSAPTDQLETLWSQSFGISTKSFIKSLSADYSFSSEQIALRNSIGQRLSEIGLSHPLALQLMIANFLLSPPGLLTINNVENFFPNWLVKVYSELYVIVEADIAAPSNSYANDTAIPASFDNIPVPTEFGPFPSTLFELSSNRIHLNRILGLSNLYYIDPEDSDIRNELLQLRLSLVLAIDNTPESELQGFFAAEFGDRYWSLVRSGIQKEPLGPSDLEVRNNVVERLNPDKNGGFDTPNALNAFLIAMLYFLPGTVNVPDAESKIPSWLLPVYKEIFAQ
jgi:hypothetical protein